MLPSPLAKKAVELVQILGTAGISSDEEATAAPGQMRQYTVFEKPWRAEAIDHLYRYLDLVHASTRNPNGNPIRQRHRVLGNCGRDKPPSNLPADCYDPIFMERVPPMRRRLISPSKPFGVEQLWRNVQRSSRSRT